MKEGKKILLATKPHLAGDVPQVFRPMATSVRKLQRPGMGPTGRDRGHL